MKRLQALDDALWIKESLLDAMRDGEIYGNGLSETESESDVESRQAKLLLPVLPPRLRRRKKNGKNALAAIQER